MKEPIVIIWNDAHLKTGNERQIYESARHMIDYAVKNKIKKVIFAGDLFDNRSFQRQELLMTFDKILGLFENEDIDLYLFPGNHDKTVYASFDSFLEVFRHYPNVHFNRKIKRIEIEGVTIDLLPFFSDDMLVPMLKEAEGADILISHFEMAGSTNMGHTSEKKTITRRTLKKWRKVYLGHYHNWHEISKDIVHLPSLVQASFGEDSNKGFSVLHKDLSYELIRGAFRQFNKILIDIDTITSKELKELIKTHENSDDIIRFEFTGKEEKLKAIDKVQFKGTGIDIKIKFEKVFDPESLIIPVVIKEYDKDTVRDTFKNFCGEKELDHEKGRVLLEEFFNRDAT